jgi:transcription initiation factor TFIID TATA-box-binding protein
MRAAADEFVRVLEGIGASVLEYDFEHSTSVFMEDLEREVNLSALAVALGMEDTEYEPEQFPGLIYRADCGSTLLVFALGKVIISGTTVREVASSAVEDMREKIATAG